MGWQRFIIGILVGGLSARSIWSRRSAWQRLTVGILLISALLTVATLSVFPTYAQTGPRPLTPEQQRLLAEKARALAAAGIPDISRPSATPAQPNQPVHYSTRPLHTTRAELLARWQTAWAADQAYIARVHRETGPDAARRIRERYEAQRRSIEALPDGPIDQRISMVEMGGHSAAFSNFTYDCCAAKDPITIFFYWRATPPSVQYDMVNWTSRRWKWTDCGSWQQVFVADAQHIGGVDAWRTMDTQLEPAEQPWGCGLPRDHIRLFGAFVEERHSDGSGSFGWWSVGSAHHDNWGHTCTDDWEGPESRVRASFTDPYTGQPLWFVGAIWFWGAGNAGQWQCAYNDGTATAIQLLY